jgi:predicted nucleic acid-binding protein
MPKRISKIFLDSNVILSGLISDKGPPRIILDVLTLRLPFLMGSTGEYNLIEIERNLKKKMPGLLSVYKRYLPSLNLKVIPLPRPAEIRDFFGKIADKDIPVLVSAIRGKVDFLITGDKQHFEKLKASRKYPFKIITPSEFLDVILPEIIRGAAQAITRSG